MNSTVLKLEEKFHLQKTHYKHLSLSESFLAFCKRTLNMDRHMDQHYAGEETAGLPVIPKA